MLSYFSEKERNFLLPSGFVAAKHTVMAQEKSRDSGSHLYMPGVQS